ncbi:dihydrofolate reductase family protein [Paenibacillus favisporus]|uniref:dihydrofolate reductase family protein n=1 Tax=Paenibacillus favisporus TaxID=221028 RepID=UPI002DBC75BD|nr:dihydrofolate reductase family protein [Paenibacillus favisporus]MEC0174493.1 dihydrofolate reductase family protein [Paenibacillus favisporus]
MGKVIVQQFVTLDGVMQAPGDPGEFEHGGWQKPYVCEDHLTYIVQQANEAEALLLGRKTYEGFAAAWPSAAGMRGLADRMNAMPKYVASSTLTHAAWNAALIHGDVADEVAKLKKQLTGDLLVVGSRRLTQALMEHHLVDEYRIWVHPVVLGSGERLFLEGGRPFSLDLASVQSTSAGAVILTYRSKMS